MNNSNSLVNLTEISINGSIGTVKRSNKDMHYRHYNTIVVITIVFVLLIVVINGFVGYVFYRYSVLLNKPSNKLLLSLSICDLLTGICACIDVWIEISPDFSSWSTKSCQRCYSIILVSDISTSFLVQTAIIHLCMLIADQFLSLFFALRYYVIVTHKRVNQIIFATWIIPFLTSSIQLCYGYPFFNGHITEEEGKEIFRIEKWYAVISLVVYMFIPFSAVSFALVLMFREIKRILVKTPNRKMNKHGTTSQKHKILYIFTLMYICFFILTVPYFTLRLIWDFNYKLEDGLFYLSVGFMFKTATSLINPILYGGLNREFRSTIVKMVKNGFCKNCNHPSRTSKTFRKSEDVVNTIL